MNDVESQITSQLKLFTVLDMQSISKSNHQVQFDLSNVHAVLVVYFYMESYKGHIHIINGGKSVGSVIMHAKKNQ